MKCVLVFSLLCFANLSWAESIADKHTVALWHFNEMKGDVLHDFSGNGHHGRIYGAKWDENGIFDGCLLFDGIDDFVEILGSNELVPNKKLTLETWIKINATTYRRFAIISKADNYRGGDGYLWEIESDGRPKSYLNSTDWEFSRTIIPLNEWVYLAITFDGSKLRYYINGEETDFFEAGSKKIISNNLNLIIGRTYNTCTYFFPGWIDEIRISSIARTGTEIKQNWLSAKSIEKAAFVFHFVNGDRISGEIIQPAEILLETKYGNLEIPTGDILSIDFDYENKEDLVTTSSMRITGLIKNDSFRLKSDFDEFEVSKKKITIISH